MNFNFNMKDIFDVWGWPGLIISIIILILVTLLKSDFFSKIISKFSDWVVEKFMKNKIKDINEKKITQSDITNHDIFNYIDFWVYSKVPTIQFSTEYRTVIFRKYLTLYLKSYKSVLSTYVNSKEFESMDDAQICKSLLNLINSIVYDYEKEMSNVGIPKVIIDKMKEKNNTTISLMLDLIDGVCGSQFYKSENNLLKVYSILNILLSVLENTISNSESVCNSINGQLKGLSYEGKTEP